MGEVKKVSVEAIEELRAENGKLVPIGDTTTVSKEAADILVAKKQAKLVTQTKG